MNKLLAAGLVSLLPILGFSAFALGASVSGPIPLWPQGAPDENGSIGKSMTPPNPTAAWWRPAGDSAGRGQPANHHPVSPVEGKANGAAVVVCPGGGYGILAMDLEGTEICHGLIPSA